MLKWPFRLCVLFLAAALLFDWCLIFLVEQKAGKKREDQTAVEKLQDELHYFPIPLSVSDRDLAVHFVDSWMGERSFGGDRVHEGCDLITSIDTPGVFPVVSISDGVVERMGWLRLGGYRVGIRTDSGNYLYYAHLESYAPGLEEGKRISAGECIGFVGDSGYGDEGTTGMFVTHLHVGFYIPADGSDVAINPYPYLLQLQEHQLQYIYQEP